MIRRIAFFSGLVLGSGFCAWVLGSALIFFFTGKMPAIVVDKARGISVKLFDFTYKAPAAGDKE